MPAWHPTMNIVTISRCELAGGDDYRWPVTDLWVPLSARLGASEVLRDEVTAALAEALRHWIERVARDSASLCERALLRCDLARDREHGPDDADDVEFLAWFTPDELLLDVVDALLDLLPTGMVTGQPAAPKIPAGQKPSALETVAISLANMMFTSYRRPLQQLLNDGRSAYTIRRDGRGLVRRVDATVAALVNTAARVAEQPDRGSASTHLKRGYAAAYTLHPDPTRAYSEAIKAVEAAAHAALEPDNQKATLGTMVRVLRDHQDRLVVALTGKTGTEGLQTVESMMQLLWTGQTSRHGNLHTTRDETAEEAQMAVHLAASLVHWFSTGAVRRC